MAAIRRRCATKPEAALRPRPLSVAAVERMMAFKKGKRPRGADALRDRIWHDVWMCANGPALCSVVDEVIAALDALDEARRAKLKAAGKRIRKPQPDEVERRRLVIGNILANLLFVHHDQRGRRRVIVEPGPPGPQSLPAADLPPIVGHRRRP